MDKKLQIPKCCLNCANRTYIGEGDYYCDVAEAIVLTDWADPTDDFMACKGDEWEKE